MAKISECKHRIFKGHSFLCVSPLRFEETGEIFAICPYSCSNDSTICPYFKKEGVLYIDAIEKAIYKYQKIFLPPDQVFELAVYINHWIAQEIKRARIVYKIVVRYKDWLDSAIVKNKANVSYSPGKWVEAPLWLQKKGYHLTAFKDFKSAIEWLFTLNIPSAELWEAEASEIITQLPPMLQVSSLEEGIIKEVVGSWPKGTVMAKKLRLIRKLGDVKTLRTLRELFEDYLVDILLKKEDDP